MSSFPLPTFRQIIDDLTTFNVVYADQNAPRDAKPYCTVRLQSNRGMEHAEWTAPNTDDNRDVLENQVATVELNLFGLSALSEAATIRNKLRFENTLDSFFASNLALINRGTVTNLSMLLNNSQYEQRAMFEVEIAWRSVETENVGHIETVEIQGTLLDQYQDGEYVTLPSEVSVEIVFETL